MSRTKVAYNALIRTHHITSRKKVGKLKQAADDNAVFVLLRSGGSPGIMYVEGAQIGVEQWVSAVQRLRYKDYHLAARPEVVSRECEPDSTELGVSGLVETKSVKDFGLQMQQRGVINWWRKAMGYTSNDERL